MHEADTLPAFVALADENRVGLLTYHIVKDEFEVVTLHAELQGRGVGTRLLEAALGKAKEAVCRRLWLITTNDNDAAIAFYRGRGMTLVAIHRGAVAESRRLKPDIPLYGVNGTRIEDELEFEVRLQPAQAEALDSGLRLAEGLLLRGAREASLSRPAPLPPARAG